MAMTFLSSLMTKQDIKLENIWVKDEDKCVKKVQNTVFNWMVLNLSTQARKSLETPTHI